MNILLLGANGQVGWQLQRSLAMLGTVTSLDRSSTAHCGDLANVAGLAQTIQRIRPDAIVNAAAYTAVDKAEADSATAFAINATACEVLAREAQATGAWLVHYSTDYVFDGRGTRPWKEEDPTAPVNTYGASKLAGEQAITAQTPRHLIFRTSWVYESWGQNFLKSMLRAASTRDSLNVVCDQWGAPTRAALIADVTAHALRQVLANTQSTNAGIYHLAAAGETHWQAYARSVIQHARTLGMPLKTSPENVHPIPAAQYPVAAPRPSNSRLDTSKLRSTFGLHMPPWQVGVHAVVAELAALHTA